MKINAVNKLNIKTLSSYLERVGERAKGRLLQGLPLSLILLLKNHQAISVTAKPLKENFKPNLAALNQNFYLVKGSVKNGVDG